MVTEERAAANLAVKSLAKHLGQDIKLVYVADKTVLTDYYVFCVGRSSAHMQALASTLEDELAEKGVYARKIEGKNSAEWILADFGSVIVHIFSKQSSEFYHMEKLFPAESFLDIDKLLDPEND